MTGPFGLSSADIVRRLGMAPEAVPRWETRPQPMGAVANRLLRLLVVTHQPSERSAVDDLLRDLNLALRDALEPDEPAQIPEHLQ